MVLTAVLTGDIVGKQKFAPAFGLLYCITGVPMMLGPPVAGKIRLKFTKTVSVNYSIFFDVYI